MIRGTICTYDCGSFPSQLEYTRFEVLGCFSRDDLSHSIASRELQEFILEQGQLLRGGEKGLRTFTCLIIGFPINSDVRLGEDSLDMEMKFKTPGGIPA